MPNFLCVACGTQFAESLKPPALCPICCDDRQFIPEAGQQWTAYGDVLQAHNIDWRDETPEIAALSLSPDFGIGQRALVVRTGAGNVLWDCLSMVDVETKARIDAEGGLIAVAISHPHYYTAMVEWSRAFGGVPVYLHADDSKWIQRPDPAINLWTGERMDLAGAATLIRCGGHFPGGTVMHCAGLGPGGDGVLFTGDVIQVAADRRHVSFMYSYPNMIPLDGEAVRRIGRAVSGLPFDAIYGAFPGRTIKTGGPAALARSIDRYLAAIGAA